jgi:hypothetical protein
MVSKTMARKMNATSSAPPWRERVPRDRGSRLPADPLFEHAAEAGEDDERGDAQHPMPAESRKSTRCRRCCRHRT